MNSYRLNILPNMANIYIARYIDDARFISFRIIFPSIIMGTIFNQQLSNPGLLIMGQIISWLAMLSAAAIVLTSFRNKGFVIIILVGIFLSKFGRVVMSGQVLPEFIYIVLYCVLFGMAGAITIFNHAELIYKQIMAIFIISIPWMILQIIGVGEWTQFLRTDIHGINEINQVATLFVTSENVIITTLQARPAGFFYANNYLSVIILFAMGLHFGMFRKAYLTVNDIILSLVMVLSMAKIVFLTFFAFVIWRFVSGTRAMRQRIIKICILVVFLICIYKCLFPGLFAYNLSVNNLLLNMGIRIFDLNLSLGGNGFLEKILEQYGDVSGYQSLIASGHESGYAKLGSKLYWIFAFCLLLTPFFIQGYKRIKYFFPESSDVIMSSCLLIFLVPLITPFIESAIYWFSIGIAFIPFLLKLGLVVERRATNT